MPDFWEYPTVSMGLGPISAIYQARFNRYLQNRGMLDTTGSRVWAFVGDGETDEPESLGALHVAAREGLDNLTFVVNCNLQRLDGPVRGNGKIIQELEGEFRGAGWNVIKVIWGSYWDPLIARDKEGILLRIMEEAVDGEYQNYKANDGAFVRKHFFGKHPKALELVARMSDEDIWRAGTGEESHPPAEEGRHLDHQGDARPVRHPDPGRQARRAAVLYPAAGCAGDEIPARAAQGARRLPAAAASEGRQGAGGAFAGFF
jgi:pyruvate dehydrogenase complex dehydrogenase (E1) component